MNKTAQHTCLNCGHLFTGNYCNHCGEKLYSEHDKKVSHLFHEAFHFLTHFDNKFFRALRMIFASPGRLSAEFTAGRRKNTTALFHYSWWRCSCICCSRVCRALIFLLAAISTTPRCLGCIFSVTGRIIKQPMK